MKEVKIQIPEKSDLDEALVGVLRFFLDSEAKSKIYLYLRKNGASTSQQVSRGANLYPSSAREALLEMAKAGVVSRRKMEVSGVGKKPYVYEAITPGELLKKKLDGIESKLNRLLNLDTYVKDEPSFKHPRIPYRVRIEKVTDDEGVEHVLVKSESDEANV